MANVPVLDSDVLIDYLRGGELLLGLREAGAAIDVRDAMQAGICLEAGTTLLTRNSAHFDRVPGLLVRHPGEL